MIRVLVVDDDKLARAGLLTMLPWAEYGMRVVGEAGSGARALEFLAANEVDLCFVDLMMPVMPGLEFIRAASELYPRLRYVVLTFHEDFCYVQSALRLGVLDYISKLELEHADVDQIMRRLTEKIERAPLSRDAFESGELLWANELLGRRWLYDSCAMEALIGQIDTHPAPLTAVERLLVRFALLFESDVGLAGPPVPRLTSLDQVKEYLASYRGALIEQAEAASDQSRLPVCLLKAICMVKRCPGGDLHTETVAQRVGLSRPYFSSSFSREVGIPFNAYVRRERVREAKRLLRGTELSVIQVAERVGYEDARSFGKLFLELVGETPSAYRAGRG